MCDNDLNHLEELLKNHFGKIVTNERKKLGINQEEFAHRCDLHKDSISRIENAKTLSNLLTFFKIAKGSEKDPITLFIELAEQIEQAQNENTKKK